MTSKQSVITLTGSTDIVVKFFEYAVNRCATMGWWDLDGLVIRIHFVIINTLTITNIVSSTNGVSTHQTCLNQRLCTASP